MSHWHPNIQQLVLYGLRSMKEIHPENFSQVLQNFKSKRQTVGISCALRSPLLTTLVGGGNEEQKGCSMEIH